MKIKKQYVVLSPDGFTIHPTDTHSSLRKAVKAIETWKEGYKRQGYYSSNTGRIELEDLADNCTIQDLIQLKKIL